MVDSLNLTGLNVDGSGRVTFSGLSSGIDYKSAVDAIIAARRIPVDSIETKVSDNKTKITAYQGLQSLLETLQSSVSTLRGAVSFGDTGNAFKAKEAFASVSRADGGTPSAAGNLLGVSVTNAAAVGSHTIEIKQVATAHKLGSRNFSSQSTDLGTASGAAAGSIAGSFSINGKTIDVLSTDTLLELRDRINAANSGTTATGVTASIVSTSSNQHILVLTADKTATDIAIGNETGGVLSALGISSDGGTTFLNELQASQKAQFYADGLLDASKWKSGLVASNSAALSAWAGVTVGSHSFDITDDGGAVIKTISYDDTDTLQTLATKITDAGLGLAASVVADGSSYRISVSRTGQTDNSIGFSGDTDNLLTGLGLAKERLVLERDTNTVNDLFAGVTLSLYGAEAGTTVKIDIDRNLAGVKSAIGDFVDAYNAVRQFINQQQAVDPSTGERSADAGPLFGSRTLADVTSQLSRILGTGVAGVNSAFSVLAQAGISFVDNSTLSDATLNDTLEIDETKLDEALLNNPSDLQRLFAFDFSTSDPRVSLLAFNGQTTYSDTGYTLNVTHDGTKITAADINGIAGSVTISGNTLTLTDKTAAEGLKLVFNGNSSVSGIQLDFTVGVGAEMYYALDSVLDPTSGSLQAEIDSLTDQNTQAEQRAEEMLTRLDYQREQLTARFVAMETALSTMNQILDTIKQTTDAWYASSNN